MLLWSQNKYNMWFSEFFNTVIVLGNNHGKIAAVPETYGLQYTNNINMTRDKLSLTQIVGTQSKADQIALLNGRKK